ncbi:hypothetical protein NG01_09690 [Corynebacterium diphtheriae]|nr:hypothetical protein NG01_09690 [Corynebacterium diphtheriae]
MVEINPRNYYAVLCNCWNSYFAIAVFKSRFKEIWTYVFFGITLCVNWVSRPVFTTVTISDFRTDLVSILE